ncbi:MAG TPA: flagellar hook-length control protein FliK [Clostridiaceae bacterium]|nr:flagellar hook-length control protein FliK [Clostridiaceae bacterium]
MRIDGFSLREAALPTGITSIFERLNIGDIVRARVIDIISNEILMKLFDGTTFTAVNISGDNNITKGDFVEFIVTGKTDSQLFVETVNVKKDSTPGTDTDLSRLLESMGIKPDKDGIETVKSLKSYELPVQKETIKQVLSAVKNNSELDIEKVVFMLSSNMEIEGNNISMLNKFANEKFKIGNALMELAELLEEGADSAFFERIANDMKALSNEQNSSSGDYEAFPGTRNENIIIEPVNIQASRQSDDKQASVNEGSNALLSAEIKDYVGNGKTVVLETERKIDNRFVDIDFTGEDGSYNAKIDDSKKLSVLRKLFEKQFVNIESETLNDDLLIAKNYKEIYRLLKVIRNNLNLKESNQYSDRINSLIDNIESSIKFLNELNNYYTYIHIPVKMWDENTTTELYVFKKKPGKKQINPEDSVVYLSLDTNNLGRVDTLISLKKKNISLNFTIEKEEVISFFKDNYISLYNRLLEKGYKLVNVTYRQMKDDINIINIQKKIREIFDDKDKCTLDIKI